MQTVPLQAIPNQSFFIVLDNNEWNFTIKTANRITSVTITLNNILLIENVRTVAGQLIIPYTYLEKSVGNFIFLTQNFELPFYTQFGTTQSLVYVTDAELQAIRAKDFPPVKATDFSAIAALPLRFAPQGYVEA